MSIIKRLVRWAFKEEFDQLEYKQWMRETRYLAEATAYRNALNSLGYTMVYKNTAYTITGNDMPTNMQPVYWELEKIN